MTDLGEDLARHRTRPMTVGELSALTGVPAKTLRGYTDLGLIYTLGRSSTNYRLYDSKALWCVRTITQLRGLGLTLAEIGTLNDRNTPIGPRMARLLGDSRARLLARAADIEQTLRRIDQFENDHRGDLARTCAYWVGDPRCRPAPA